MNTKVKTRFGIASINADGYYEITSVKEGNKDRVLHRLIYEDFHNVKLPKNVHVHHKDGRKDNNCILNLEAMSSGDHIRYHRNGVKLSKSWRVNLSKARNSTNFFRVTKDKDNSCKEGFIYLYQYYENGKRRKIKSVSLERLEEKVKSKGLEWIEFN